MPTHADLIEPSEYDRDDAWTLNEYDVAHSESLACLDDAVESFEYVVLSPAGRLRDAADRRRWRELQRMAERCLPSLRRIVAELREIAPPVVTEFAELIREEHREAAG